MEKLNNPYEVLGIKEGASQEEIKKAYREQVKKYHPDQYQDNPLSQLAEEKLREINEAYEMLTKNGGAGHTTSSRARAGSWGRRTGGGSDLYNQVKSYLNAGNVQMAQELLNNAPERNAEWHYLNGLVSLRKGWYDDAVSNIQTAVNMDPNNFEYREALNRMSRSNNMYRGNSFNRGYNNGPDLCTMCQCLWCSDCCCECAGGDLISCC